MKITFIPLNAEKQAFGPYENVERANFVNQPNRGGRMLVPDHNLYFKDGKVSGIILPMNETYSIQVEEESNGIR